MINYLLILKLINGNVCDKVTDISNKEQVSVVLRFDDSACDIKIFWNLLTLTITGEVLA